MTNDSIECPLCMEPMDFDDVDFYPCPCRYQICRFCWDKILNEENGLCPACRKMYNSENPASYKPRTDEEIKNKIKHSKKVCPKKLKPVTDIKEYLSEYRVLQKNLIFVVGLPMRMADEVDLLKSSEYFGKCGKVYKIVINQNQTFPGPQGSPCLSAYVTYHRNEDTLKTLVDLKKLEIDGRPVKLSLGTTKYCSQFLRNRRCTKLDCMYLHEMGDQAASFTKDDMSAGKHTEYENHLIQEFFDSQKQIEADKSTNQSTSYKSQHIDSTVIQIFSDNSNNNLSPPPENVNNNDNSDSLLDTFYFLNSQLSSTEQTNNNNINENNDNSIVQESINDNADIDFDPINISRLALAELIANENRQKLSYQQQHRNPFMIQSSCGSSHSNGGGGIASNGYHSTQQQPPPPGFETGESMMLGHDFYGRYHTSESPAIAAAHNYGNQYQNEGSYQHSEYSGPGAYSNGGLGASYSDHHWKNGVMYCDDLQQQQQQQQQQNSMGLRSYHRSQSMNESSSSTSPGIRNSEWNGFLNYNNCSTNESSHMNNYQENGGAAFPRGPNGTEHQLLFPRQPSSHSVNY